MLPQELLAMFPCCMQAVERAVKLVAEASAYRRDGVVVRASAS